MLDILSHQITTWEKDNLHPLLPILRNTHRIPHVIFLRGISGSGKTTLCNSLSHLLGIENVVSISADNYFIKNGIYKFQMSEISEAHRSCIISMEKALESSEFPYIIMDNTHTRLWHLTKAEEIAEKYGAKIFYLDIIVPDHADFLVCLKRQCHNVPEEVLLEQWVNWEKNPKSMLIPMFNPQTPHSPARSQTASN
jgi:predicted kinase